MVTENRFTAADILGVSEKPDPEDLFESQLLHSYRSCMADIIRSEGKSRQFTRGEYQRIVSFLSAHNGNPIAFAQVAALRKSDDEVIAFVTQPPYEQIIVGMFDEQAAVFVGSTGLLVNDPDLHWSYHDHRSSRYWELRIPYDYPRMLVLEVAESGLPPRYYVMYRPAPLETPLLGVYIPYDATYPLSSKQHLDARAYVLQKERVEHPTGYLLNLGAFVEFALEVFPVLYPTYRIPEQGQGESEQILEIFLRAHYNKRFQVGATTFWVVNEYERSEHPMPDWARRWAILWGALPTGSLIGKEEILSLLDLL